MPFHLLKLNRPKGEPTFIPNLASPRDLHISIVGNIGSVFIGQVWYYQKRKGIGPERLIKKLALHSRKQTAFRFADMVLWVYLEWPENALFRGQDT